MRVAFPQLQTHKKKGDDRSDLDLLRPTTGSYLFDGRILSHVQLVLLIGAVKPWLAISWQISSYWLAGERQRGCSLVIDEDTNNF